MQASDYVARFLASQGVTHVFEVVGGMIAHLIDSMHRTGQPTLVSCHHEQGAAFAAEGYARMTGAPAVAMGTSGPGALNLLTGIGSCHFDSTPGVFITGQVNRDEQKGERPIRQLGFQETDIVRMVAPIVKAAWRVESAEELPALLREAFEVALGGRPGPVLIDIPMDVQREEVQDELPGGPLPREVVRPDGAALDAALDALAGAERPLVLVGGGVRSGRAATEFRELVDALGVPVVNSLMAVDALPSGHPLRVGLIGTYGNRWANIALGEADCLLVVGSRLDIRQTGADVDAFKGERPIFHVDCDLGEVNNRLTGCVAIEADAAAFCSAAAEAARRRGFAADLDDWRGRIDAARAEWPDTGELRDIEGVNPNQLMHDLSAAAPPALAAYVADVGQHQMWAAQSLELGPDCRFLTSGGMGAMGSGLPLAVGACFGATGRPVCLIAGDGAFQLNSQELQTVARNDLPLKMAIVNNRCHGMVRQFQETYFEGRYQSTWWGYSAPDFARLAAAYGIESATVEDPAEVPGAVSRLWADPEKPYLLQVMVDPLANAYPKIAFGHPITEMEPFAVPIGMEGT